MHSKRRALLNALEKPLQQQPILNKHQNKLRGVSVVSDPSQLTFPIYTQRLDHHSVNLELLKCRRDVELIAGKVIHCFRQNTVKGLSLGVAQYLLHPAADKTGARDHAKGLNLNHSHVLLGRKLTTRSDLLVDERVSPHVGAEAGQMAARRGCG